MSEGGKTPIGAQKEFLLLYYDVMTKRNAEGIDRRTNFIKLSLIGTFGFYAAIFSNHLKITQSEIVLILLYAPLFFNVIGFLLEIGTSIINGMRGSVLIKIESLFGYSLWTSEVGSIRGLFFQRTFSSVAKIYWLSIILISAFVPIYFTVKGIT